MTRRSTGLGQTTLEGLVIRITDNAILFDVQGGDEVWVPKKVCLDGGSVDEGDTDIIVADWWLKKEGLL